MRRLLALLACLVPIGQARAATGLGSLEGLWILYLIALVAGILLLGVLAFSLKYAVKWLRSSESQRRQLGGVILAVILLPPLAILVQYTDFNNYVLIDNHYEDASEITRDYVDRYFELADGRAFYLLDQGLGYFKPGRPLVLRANGDEGLATAYDIYEARRLRLFFERRERNENKKLWLPIIRTERKRWQLQDRGSAVLLQPDWRIEDLRPNQQPVPWCCDVGWSRLLISHGADPSLANGWAIPLYQALNPLGWTRDPQDRAQIEANLKFLLSVGTDVNAVNDDGNTALHVAALQRDDFGARWLLKRGADPSIRNARGQSPVDVLRSGLASTGRYLPPEKRKEVNDLMALLEARSRIFGARQSRSSAQRPVSQ